jgi:nitroimidazol reductase NimA-like FMN-containing flavoprotein (pyridoxamine 5'-phosphate oxidase superfamily)
VKLNETAQNIIKRIEYVTLATVDENGLPWNAPVYYAYDKDYTFYWGSHIASQHAKNVRQNSHVFLTIYNSTAAPGKGEGVYIQAICSELIDPEEISTAHALIQTRRAPIAYWKRDIRQYRPESG